MRQSDLVRHIVRVVALPATLLLPSTPALSDQAPTQRVPFTTSAFPIVAENLLSVTGIRADGGGAEVLTVTYPRCLYRGRLTGKLTLVKIVTGAPIIKSGDVLATGIERDGAVIKPAIRRVTKAELQKLNCPL